MTLFSDFGISFVDPLVVPSWPEPILTVVEGFLNGVFLP